jgi:3',5'-cyclic AMP phosphodiesterase CpdA
LPATGSDIDENLQTMRTIVHLSDVHFGKIDRGTVEPLVRAVHEARPDLVVVSGDLTQRARKGEFEEARKFLLKLPGPQIVVPGNHDVPIWNPVVRFSRPLRRFKHYITGNLLPFYEDNEIAVLGINTARPTTTKYGHINRQQLVMIREILCPVSKDKIKIIVTHHPFDLPAGYRDKRQIVGKSRRAMQVLAECGADLFLAGHLHRVFTSNTTERYRIENHAALIMQAGTATASRLSVEPNSFNLIRCHDHTISTITMHWNAKVKQFEQAPEAVFEHTGQGWMKVSEL